MMKRPARSLIDTRYAALAVLLIALALALGQLNEAMWTDERRTLFYAGAAPVFGPTTLGESVARIAENLWQAPAYYLFQWGWGRLVGWDVFTLRVSAALFGMLALALTYRLVRQHYPATVAFYTVFFLGINAFFINFLHDMRAYMLLLLVGVWVLWCYSRIVTARPARWPHYALFAVAVALFQYTHYFAVFPLAALGLTHLIARCRKPDFWPVIVAFVVAGISFLPWATVLLSGAQLAQEVPRQTLNLTPLGALRTSTLYFSNGALALTLLLGVFALRDRRRASRLFALWFGLCWAFILITMRIVPTLTDVKYIIYLLPALAFIVALGVHHLSQVQARAGLAVAAVWIVALVSTVNSDLQTLIHPWYAAPLDALAARLQPLTDPDDTVLFVTPPEESFVETPMLAYYFRDDDAQVTVIRHTFAMTDDFFYQQARDAANTPQVWLSYDGANPNWRTGHISEVVLPEAGYQACGSLPAAAPNVLSLFAHGETPVDDAAFAAEAEAVQLELLSEPHLTPEHIEFAIAWSRPEAVAALPLSVGVHLNDAAGTFLAQADFGLEPALFGCAWVQLPRNGLNEADVRIKATVYNWQTGDRLPDTAGSDDQRATLWP